MELIFAVLVGFIIFGIFRIIERYLPSYYFSFTDLVLGRFGLRDLFISIILPFLSSFIFGIFVKFDDPWIYVLPGFLAALLIVWPAIRVPELLPEELQEKRQSVLASYVLFTVSFSAFSFVGGMIARPLSGLVLLPSWEGVRDEVWAALILGVVSLFTRWLINKGLPGKWYE